MNSLYFYSVDSFDSDIILSTKYRIILLLYFMRLDKLNLRNS